MEFSPESIILYKTFGAAFPLWPAVVCTDDMATEEATNTRPRGHATLILLMGENLEFRWTRNTEIGTYDPFTPFRHEEIVGKTPGLGDAYEMANNALEAGLGLGYWRELMMKTGRDASGSDSDASDSDSEMQQALRLSREDYYGKLSEKNSTRATTSLPTPTLSPPIVPPWLAPPKTKSSSSRLPRTEASSSQAPRKRGALGVASSPQDRSHVRTTDTPTELTDGSCSSRSAGKRRVESTPFKHVSEFDNYLSGLGRGRKEPTSDTIEGELSESKEFVQFLVGPNQEACTIQKKSVWNRPYFRDPRRGLIKFDYNQDGFWEFQDPALADIDPGDFAFVAEYLESDDFGHRQPEEGKEMDEAFAQCISTYVTAGKLGMSDLMDHIVDKKLGKLNQPDLFCMLSFAGYVYGPQDTAHLSHGTLKDYLAVCIAENLWIYFEDDNLRAEFIKRLQQLPELEGDIYRRRLPVLDERCNASKDDSDTEMN